jgi:hypothetical protein
MASNACAAPGENTKEPYSLQVPDELAKGDAVYLLIQDDLEVINSTTARLTQRIIKKLLKNESDRKQFGVSGRFMQRVRKIEGVIVKPDGSEKRLDKNSITRLEGFDPSNLYSDATTQVFALSEAREGDIMDVTFMHEFKSLAFCPPMDFQRDIPIIERRVNIIVPNDVTSDFVSLNFDKEPSYARSESKRITRHMWLQTNMPAFKRESGMPSPVEVVPVIIPLIGTKHHLDETLDLSSWNGVGEWYRKLSKGRMDGGPEIDALIDELGLRGMPPAEAARKAYDYVRSNIRYVSIQLGIGGYKPHEASAVYECKYGDCKDKATLLSSLLAGVGIRNGYALVRTRGSLPIPRERPTLHFNHCISWVDVEDDVRFLDPTCPDCAWGELPSMDEGAFALAIYEDRAEPVDLPVSTADANRREDELRITVNGDGTASFEHRIAACGVYRRIYRSMFLKEGGTAPEEVLKKYLYDRGFDVTVEPATVTGTDETADSLFVTTTGTIQNFGRPEAGMVIMNPHLVRVQLPDAEQDKERKYPFVVGTPRTKVLRLTVHYPAAWQLAEVPKDVSVKGEGFEYTATATGGEGELTWMSMLVTDRLYVQPEQYPEFYASCQSVKSAERREVVFLVE